SVVRPEVNRSSPGSIVANERSPDTAASVCGDSGPAVPSPGNSGPQHHPRLSASTAQALEPPTPIEIKRRSGSIATGAPAQSRSKMHRIHGPVGSTGGSTASRSPSPQHQAVLSAAMPQVEEKPAEMLTRSSPP